MSCYQNGTIESINFLKIEFTAPEFFNNLIIGGLSRVIGPLAE
jgi:hypothetical protein